MPSVVSRGVGLDVLLAFCKDILEKLFFFIKNG